MRMTPLTIRRFAAGCTLAILAICAMGPRAQRADAAGYQIPGHAELMFLIRRQFRSHRPPPPYEVYTVSRSQMTDYGYPDPLETYSWHVWCRTYDDACLERQEFVLGAHGPLTFKRPQYDIADDPGPPTADIFQPAPARPPTVNDIPTPEPTGPLPKTIAAIQVLGEFDYDVKSATIENGLLRVVLVPRRDPERNRLREIFVDPRSYEVQRIIAHDRLFVEGDKNSPYPTTFTIDFGNVGGHPVMTKIHGVVGGGYSGDGQTVDFTFTDIAFPSSLPAWYFDPRTYASHVNDAPL